MSSENAVNRWCLYLIKTAKNTLYCGITVDVARRFQEHCAQSTKTAKALRGRAPLELMYVAELNSHSEALKAELWVKAQARNNKLKLISAELWLPFEHSIKSLDSILSQSDSDKSNSDKDIGKE